MEILSYDRLEDELAARLSALIPLGYEVKTLPDTEAELQRPAGFQPRVTVAYTGSNFGDGADNKNPIAVATGAMAQTEYCTLDVVFESQKLRTNRGYHEALRQAMRLLLGFKPTGWSKIFFRTNEFKNHADGVFVFHLVVSCYRMVIEATDEHGTPLGLDGTTGLPADPLLTAANFDVNV
jgi:hypothetical protein